MARIWLLTAGLLAVQSEKVCPTTDVASLIQNPAHVVPARIAVIGTSADFSNCPCGGSAPFDGPCPPIVCPEGGTCPPGQSMDNCCTCKCRCGLDPDEWGACPVMTCTADDGAADCWDGNRRDECCQCNDCPCGGSSENGCPVHSCPDCRDGFHSGNSCECECIADDCPCGDSPVDGKCPVKACSPCGDGHHVDDCCNCVPIADDPE